MHKLEMRIAFCVVCALKGRQIFELRLYLIYAATERANKAKRDEIIGEKSVDCDWKPHWCLSHRNEFVLIPMIMRRLRLYIYLLLSE
jgi:hypothetical protein